MARTPRLRPVDGATDWPKVSHPDGVGEVARRFVLNIQEVIGNRSIRSVAAQAGLDHNTLRRVMSGEAWPDLIVIAKLESALGADLWPGRIHRDS